MEPVSTHARGTKRTADEAGLPPEAPRRIRALDQDVVNKIAAGEIIIAPVHALKELTENAVDAGSTSLEILVKDGGMKLLQITDNGHGINRDDLPILCERFTTSKLKAFEDLTSIGTYGFRGEALASISHIAHLTVTSKVKESSCAWRAHYANGKLAAPKQGQSAEPKPTAGRQGTQITVEDIFYNVPTRRKAFRSASEEYAKILDLVGRYAVHCTDVAFSCKKHGDALNSISVQKEATTVDRIRQIHGTAVANELLQFSAENESWGFKASGCISSANYSVKKMTLLLFINHRAVESTAIKKAIEQSYAVFLPKGGHPFVYLSLEIDPQRVDVNVHPTKREVNFLNEDEIIDCICEEMRGKLSSVDTSRTFATQTLLPGAKIPTISAGPLSTSAQISLDPVTPSRGQWTQQTPSHKTPTTKPYENNLVRTDSRAQKITTFLQSSACPNKQSARLTTNDQDPDNTPQALEDSMDYTYTEKQPTICRLATIKDLRAQVRSSMHQNLTSIFTAHAFVGIVDHTRRMAAIQSGVKLFLVDYGLCSAEYFYQLGLTDFANFGSIRLDPPLDLREIIDIACEAEEASLRTTDPEEAASLDWAEVASTVHDQLLSQRDMLAEYFSLEISEDGELLGLPLLMKGYMPSMAKLPRFLLRLGPHVDWTDEKGCFRTFLRELAAWYVPEAVENDPFGSNTIIEARVSGKGRNHEGSRSDVEQDASATEAAGDDAMVQEDAVEEQNQDASAQSQAQSRRRKEISNAVESLLFPAFKARLIATKGMLKGVVEVADLKGLYRVFERC